MKAIVYTQYGSPDVLHLEEVEKPTPTDDQVLVKIYATSITAADIDQLRGTFLIRLAGIRKPQYKILGSDFAGRVESVGKNVTGFQVGDEVYGDLTEGGFGAFAEYVCVSESFLALKPVNLTFEQAAAATSVGCIALQGVNNRVQAGQKVLINGAGGGVGTFAVQVAKSLGADVTGVDSAGKLAMVRSIGADHVMDYDQADFTQNGQKYDLILDMVARRSIFHYQRSLTPTGTYLVVGGTVSAIFQAFFVGTWLSRRSQQHLGVLMMQVNQKNLMVMKDFLEAGDIMPVIDKTYAFKDIPVAFRYFEEGHVRGKVVITVAQ